MSDSTHPCRRRIQQVLCAAIANVTLLALTACHSSPPAQRLDTIQDRIVRVELEAHGSASVQFELSPRVVVIDAQRSPSPAEMIAFAQSALVRSATVFATIDSGPMPRTKGDSGPPFVLMRLAETPDTAMK